MCDCIKKLTPRNVAVGVASAALTIKLLNMVRGSIQKQRLASIAQAKRRVVAQEVEAVEAWIAKSTEDGSIAAVDEATQKAVLTMNIKQLQARIGAGEWSIPYVLKIFFVNLVAAHKKTNCVVAITLEDALVCAKAAQKKVDDCGKDKAKLDALFAEFPLLGMPFSIKDNINVKGTDSTLGVVTNAFRPVESDGDVVRQIRRAGGLILAKTNIPQTLLSYECFNDLFGACGNPVKPEFTCGGSSGGEGALVALGGSVAGIGSDIGGSIRIPAHFCGIYGLKPSQYRIPNFGQIAPVTQEAIASVLGPMARNMDDLEALFKATIKDASQLDVNVMNAPFRQDIFDQYKSKNKLRFAYYTDDGFVEASPASKRALKETVAALRAQGHECVEVAIPNSTEIMEIFYWFLAADGGKSVSEALNGDAPSPAVKTVLKIAAAPLFVKKILGWVISFKSQTMGVITSNLSERSVKGYYDLLKRRNTLRRAHGAAMSGFDALLAPGLIFPAPKQGATAMLSYGAAYTGLHNLLDSSVVTIPVTTVDKEKDEWDASSLNPKTTNNYFMATQIRNAYSATDMHGLPVGVQVICTRFSEEQVLAVAGRVDASLKK